MHGIINEHARGTTLSAPHEHTQTHAQTHTHTRTHADTQTQTHLQTYADKYTSTLCMYTHIFEHTQPDYFAYLLSKQSLVGSPLFTPVLHQSIKLAPWDPDKPRYSWSDLKLVAVLLPLLLLLLLLTGSHCKGDLRFKINAVCSKRKQAVRFFILKLSTHPRDIRVLFFSDLQYSLLN